MAEWKACTRRSSGVLNALPNCFPISPFCRAASAGPSVVGGGAGKCTSQSCGALALGSNASRLYNSVVPVRANPATSIGFLFWVLLSSRASLPTVVVFPEPCSPTSINATGFDPDKFKSS